MTLPVRDPLRETAENPCSFSALYGRAGKRRPRTIAYGGEEHTFAGWAKKTGIPKSVLQARVSYGWPAERVFTEPVAAKSTGRHTMGGETLSISAWARRYGISPVAISRRMQKGLALDAAIRAVLASKDAEGPIAFLLSGLEDAS